ncbi:Lrp/AsnC family transcriptional regulator [Streptantibioticus cattleyicolor]|nr:Lrp/AsnC family transcriptional regulator [Streptantibioticus cattleyicolor]CCB71880.1 Transcriptional regulator [Streptantibioticus cattleyicolor NRRL 8057 = DSM 46488]
MTREMAVDALDDTDQRLIAALQCDGRLTAERAGRVLGLSARTVHRRWRALLADGVVRVVAAPDRGGALGATLLRVKVLRGTVEVIADALAARPDVPYVDLSATGDEIHAVAVSAAGARDALVFRRLTATRAVTSVTAAQVVHVFAYSSDWRHDVLTPAERAALAPPRPAPAAARGLDAVDRDVLAALRDDARAPAAAVAAACGHPDSTVRRRIAALSGRGLLRTEVWADVRRLGLAVDANVLMRVAPARLDAVGRALARHPAVHGAFATAGRPICTPRCGCGTWRICTGSSRVTSAGSGWPRRRRWSWAGR